MRVVVIAAVAVAAGLIVAGLLGVATAEAPTSAPQRVVSVQGVATESIDRAASAQTATAAYHQGMLDAVTDGQAKAQLLAGRAGTALGPIQSLIEDGGYITCSNAGESAYAEYEGAQPDFGSTQVPIGAAPLSAGTAPQGAAVGPRRPAVRKSPPRRRHTAKKAALVSCTLSARVSLAYTIG
jgi:hypothetical protein